MPIRITSVPDDIVKFNEGFRQLEVAQNAIKVIQQRVLLLNTARKSQPPTLPHFSYGETSQFMWDGPSSTVSWLGFKLFEPLQNTTITIVPGSKQLTPSTFYWIGWNPVQQQLNFETNKALLYVITGNIFVCQIFTGTAGQTGSAGGGGTTPGGIDDAGLRYKLF